jgi:hypothetical protein
VTTFGLGHLLVNVLGTSSPFARHRFAGCEPAGSLQIWPQPHPRSILWPPANIIGDDEAYFLANMMRKSGFFDHSRDRAANWTFAF